MTCQLDWGSREYHVLHVNPASFSGTPGLSMLRLYNVGQLQLVPRSFSSLPALVELALVNCGLTAVPAALSGVRHTLQRLDLICNTEMQIDQAGFDTLLALPVLESVNLKKSLYPGSSNWTDCSVSFLVRFLSEWQDLRPGAPRPALCS